MNDTNALSPMIADTEMQRTLLTAIGFDRLSAPERELALAICRQYSLDPLLRHLVLVDGKPYITRDGLLHVAHLSGQFDGIEVDQPKLDDDGKYFRTVARVYRKDISRPFSYPGRYPAQGPERGPDRVNSKYAEEMTIKVAEVMTLRRAFDVSAPVLEERWAGDLDAPEVTTAPLTDRIAARAAEIEASMTDDGPRAEGIGQVLAEMESDGDIALVTMTEPEEGELEAFEEAVATTLAEAAAIPSESDGDEPIDDTVEPEDEPVLEPEPAPTLEDRRVSLTDFKEAVKGVPRQLVRDSAKAQFPDKEGFKDLSETELGSLLTEIERATAAEIEANHAADAKPVLCGLESPYEDGRSCTMDKGHAGPHRAGVTTSW